MKIYISGKMAGVPYLNFPAFDAAAKKLRDLGYEVFSPADKDRERFGADFAMDNPTGDIPPGFDMRETFAIDCEYICKHADAMYMLHGWEASGGARAEWALARVLRLKMFYEDSL